MSGPESLSRGTGSVAPWRRWALSRITASVWDLGPSEVLGQRQDLSLVWIRWRVWGSTLAGRTWVGVPQALTCSDWVPSPV